MRNSRDFTVPLYYSKCKSMIKTGCLQNMEPPDNQLLHTHFAKWLLQFFIVSLRFIFNDKNFCLLIHGFIEKDWPTQCTWLPVIQIFKYFGLCLIATCCPVSIFFFLVKNYYQSFFINWSLLLLLHFQFLSIYSIIV